MADITNLERLIGKLPCDVDAAIVTGAFNRRYLTGLKSSAGTLVITRDGCGFFIDSRYHELAVGTVKGCDVILQDSLDEQLSAFLRERGAKTVAVESEVCTVKRLAAYREKLEGVTLLEDDRLSDLIAMLRGRKSAEELAKMRASQNIADKTFDHILGFIRPGLTEREIALEMERCGRAMGAEGVSFSLIVASGSHSSMPHAVPSGKKIEAGELLLMDFGFLLEGYCSDMTRTVAVGRPTDRQREVYQIVLDAQNAAFEAIRPGAICKEVDAAARKLIDATPYSGLFGHGLGHSLGLEVHEPPGFNRISGAALEPGMVLSVEPGVYIPGQFGVRIEDVIAVTEGGFENLTGSPKELIVV